jgi:GR25 family glycosyltransferase involved in LPS biosynthesis
MIKIKKYQFILSFFIFIFISIIILYYLNFYQENFENPVNSYDLKNIQYYVITMGQQNRIENIKKQTDILNHIIPNKRINIKKVDAINGDDLDLEQMIKDGIIAKGVVTDQSYNELNLNLNRRKYEVGCYLSHLKVYNTVSDDVKNNIIDSNGYSVYFEDDFEIQENYSKELQKAINYLIQNNMDFDILFLGFRCNDNKHIGSNIYKPVCEKKYNCALAHAVLINNKNINKIINKISNIIENPIDTTIAKLSEKNELIIYRIMPDIVSQYSHQKGSLIQ